MIEARWQPMKERVNKTNRYHRAPFGAKHFTIMQDLERELRALSAKGRP